MCTLEHTYIHTYIHEPCEWRWLWESEEGDRSPGIGVIRQLWVTWCWELNLGFFWFLGFFFVCLFFKQEYILLTTESSFLVLLLKLLFYIYLFIWGGVTHATVYLWWSDNNCQELVLNSRCQAWLQTLSPTEPSCWFTILSSLIFRVS